MQRQPELHVSALSPAEFRAYTRYLDLIALTASRTSSGGGGLDADGTVRFDRAVVRDFCVERLGVPRGIVDDALTSILPSAQRLTAGNIYALLRLLGHIVPSSGSSSPRKALDPELVFVPGEPLPLDPFAPLPLAPPRRAPSLHSRGSRSISGPAVLAPRPALPPRRAISPPLTAASSGSSIRASADPTPPSPPNRRAPFRKSLPAAHSLDPFRDTPSPTTSPNKPRTLSGSGAAVGSNNPFRAAPSPLDFGASVSAPATVAAPSPPIQTHTAKVGPPLPPRKPSVRRPASTTTKPAPVPALPPRHAIQTRARGDSVSSNSTWGDSPQPTSIAQPSDIIQQSLAAAAAGEMSRRKEEPVFQVISSSSALPTSAPAPGRRDIIDTVTRAVRESEVDEPPAPLPPPQRSVSLSRHKTTLSLSALGAFNTVAEQYRAKHPGLKTWSPVSLLVDRPQRSPFAMVLLNQPILRRDVFLRAWAASTLRYCADGGANRLYDALEPEERRHMLPTMIKGDLDSIRPDVKAYYASKGVAIKRDGDEYSTDLHKCIAEIESIESTSGKRFSLLLFGGLSGRVDQTIGIMSTMLKLRAKRRDTYIISEESLAWVLDQGTHLIEIDHSTMGQTCGILPVGVTEAFVRTEGLKWNLDWVTSMEGELSTSNHLLPSEPVVFLETSAPVFWTVEIKESLPLPHTPSTRSPPVLSPSTADELTRGVKELGAGLARAAGGVAEVGKGLGRRLSSRQGPLGLNSSAGASSNGDVREDRDRDGDGAREWDRDREQREKERVELKQRQRETTGLVSAASATARGDSEDERYADGGYALLD